MLFNSTIKVLILCYLILFNVYTSWEIVYVNPDITNESDFPKKKKKNLTWIQSVSFFFFNYILFLCGRVGGVSSKVVEEKSLEE